MVSLGEAVVAGAFMALIVICLNRLHEWGGLLAIIAVSVVLLILGRLIMFLGGL